MNTDLIYDCEWNDEELAEYHKKLAEKEREEEEIYAQQVSEIEAEENAKLQETQKEAEIIAQDYAERAFKQQQESEKKWAARYDKSYYNAHKNDPSWVW